MIYRFLISLLLLLPMTATAVYFPDGIDWTNPSQNRFVQSLYLNMLGRAPAPAETRNAAITLRRNDNRTARLTIFESVLQSSEYQRNFSNTENTWRVYQAPDYNYHDSDGNSTNGYYRYQAATALPTGFTRISGGDRSFTQSVAHSIARYYDAFCYRGDPCIDNPELARDKTTNALTYSTIDNANIHACADTANLNSQFKWVAINGTTYPRGIGQETICLEDSYFEANQLNLERYDCEAGYKNCKRNTRLDLRASRSGQDNDGYSSFFFRDGSRLAMIQTHQQTANNTASNTNARQPAPVDPLLADEAHACTDPQQTTSRFTWQSATQSAESKGIGSNTICMDDYYYTVQRMTLIRHNCDSGFVNCRPDPNNNLAAVSHKSVDGNPSLVFSNGTSLIITARGLAPESTATGTTTTQRSTQNNQSRPLAGTQIQTSPNIQAQAYSGSDCADSKKRLSQFRWKSQGLSSWPDGIDGKIICLNNSYYEITPTGMKNYSCQNNYTRCTANPSKNLTILNISQDGTVWALNNGDELTLLNK